MILLIVAAALAIIIGSSIVLGAPYVPAHRKDMEIALELSELKAGETLLDLGCGDGRALRAAARRGANAIGYEINPVVWLVAWLWCWPQRDRISVRFGDFWGHQLPKCDVVFVFLIRRHMPRLERKLLTEAQPGLRVASYVFTLPTQRPVAAKGPVTLYRFE